MTAAPSAVDTERPLTSELKKRLLRGLGSTALTPVVTAIIQLGTVPLLLHAWGAAKYGDWLVLSAIPSYLSLANLGFGDASGSDMTVRVAKGDRQGALETFQSSWALVLMISAAAFALVAAVVQGVPWHRWMRLSSLSNTEAAEVVFILATYVVAGQQCGVIESGYRCDGNFALGTLLGTTLRLVETIAATVAGVITGSLLACATTFLIVRSLGTVLYALVLRHRCSWISLGFRYARPGRIRELAAPALGFIALPLGNAISIQGFTILIGILSGPIAVTMFSTLRTLARLNFQLTTVIAWAIWPELSAAFGAGDIGLARVLHRRAYQASLALSLAAGVFLWFTGPLIYRAWIRNTVAFDPMTFHILLVVTLANSLWFTSSVVPMSTNAHNRLTIAFTIASAIALGAGWVLVRLIGISGAACSLLLIDSLMVSLVLRASLRQLRETFTDFAGSVIRLSSSRLEVSLS